MKRDFERVPHGTNERFLLCLVKRWVQKDRRELFLYHEEYQKKSYHGKGKKK